MNLNELKKKIEEKTGIPAALISGTTPGECFDYARKLAAFRGGEALRTEDAGAGKATRDKFADYFTGIGYGEAPKQESFIDRVESAIEEISPNYPNLPDHGEAAHIPSGRSAAEAFAEYFNGVFSFDPSRHTW